MFRQEASRDRSPEQQMSDELIIFGSPFPNIENDNKNYVPVWKQKVGITIKLYLK